MVTVEMLHTTAASGSTASPSVNLCRHITTSKQNPSQDCHGPRASSLNLHKYLNSIMCGHGHTDRLCSALCPCKYLHGQYISMSILFDSNYKTKGNYRQKIQALQIWNACMQVKRGFSEIIVPRQPIHLEEVKVHRQDRTNATTSKKRLY